jgi:hypothetical protein
VANQNSGDDHQQLNTRAGGPSQNQGAQQERQSQRVPQPGEDQSRQRPANDGSGERATQQQHQRESKRNAQDSGSDEPELYNEPDLKQNEDDIFDHDGRRHGP